MVLITEKITQNKTATTKPSLVFRVFSPALVASQPAAPNENVTKPVTRNDVGYRSPKAIPTTAGIGMDKLYSAIRKQQRCTIVMSRALFRIP
ncbi:hypothetical protein D9M69_482570 [compost metagenome]